MAAGAVIVLSLGTAAVPFFDSSTHLRPPSGRALHAFSASDEVDIPPLDQEFEFVSCDDAGKRTGLPVLTLHERSRFSDMFAACLIEGEAPGSRIASGQEAALHVMYFPEATDPSTHSYRDILDAGGLDIRMKRLSSASEFRIPDHDSPDNPGGGYQRTELNGEPGLAQRVRENRVNLQFRLIGDDGSPVYVSVLGDHTMDELVDELRQASAKSPAREYRRN